MEPSVWSTEQPEQKEKMERKGQSQSVCHGPNRGSENFSSKQFTPSKLCRANEHCHWHHHKTFHRWGCWNHCTYVQKCTQVLFHNYFELLHIWLGHWLFSYYFMSDRIMCVLVNFYTWGHFVMFIIKSVHLISVHFWTYLNHWWDWCDQGKSIRHIYIFLLKSMV